MDAHRKLPAILTRAKAVAVRQFRHYLQGLCRTRRELELLQFTTAVRRQIERHLAARQLLLALRYSPTQRGSGVVLPAIVDRPQADLTAFARSPVERERLDGGQHRLIGALQGEVTRFGVPLIIDDRPVD